MAKRRYTTKAEREKILKELGCTRAEMTEYFNECAEINRNIAMLASNGLTWEDLTEYQIRQLPTLKEKTLKAKEEQKIREAEEVRAKLEKEEKEKYYREHFEEIMVQNIDNKTELTEKELSTLVFDYAVSNEYCENRRWTRTVMTVVSLLGRYFMIEWEEGLTENQPNEYFEQPYEVYKHQYEKVITVTEWKKKKN